MWRAAAMGGSRRAEPAARRDGGGGGQHQNGGESVRVGGAGAVLGSRSSHMTRSDWLASHRGRVEAGFRRPVY
jgi:hypothetical protein